MSVFSFTLVDWLAVALVVFSVVVSFYKGFVREIVTLVSVAVGLVFAAWLYRPASALFVGRVEREDVRLFLGFTAVFLLAMLLGLVTSYVMSRFMKLLKLQWFDRMLGAAFGFIRGWLIGAVMFLVVTSFAIAPDSVKNSQLAPFFLPAARALAVITPYEMRAKFMLAYRDIQKYWAGITS